MRTDTIYPYCAMLVVRSTRVWTRTNTQYQLVMLASQLPAELASKRAGNLRISLAPVGNDEVARVEAASVLASMAVPILLSQN
jgi:hypothetical protein